MDAKNLAKIIGNAPLSKREIISYGVSRYMFEKWLLHGQLEKIGHGIYKAIADSDDKTIDEVQFRDATAIAGEKSAICLLSALEYYHLTDLITKKTWVMVPYEKRIKHKKIVSFRTRNPHWSVGLLKKRGYRITSLERTLIDCLVYKRKVGLFVAMEAIKLALKKKKTNLNSLYEVAKQLNALSKVKAVFEVLI